MHKTMMLTQMQYFYAVCKYENYTKAAELFVSQLAVSQAIRELEGECGMPLFVRQGKKLPLTDEGRVLMAEVGIILRQVEHLQTSIAGAGLSRSYVRLGLSTFSGNTVFPRICKAFSERYPDIRLHIHEDGMPELFQLLDKDQADAIITAPAKYLREREASGEYHLLHLFRSRGLAFCVHPDHPFAKRERVTMEEVAATPLVMLDDRYTAARGLKKQFAERGLELNILLTTLQMYTIVRFVEQNAAAGFLPPEIAKFNRNIVAVPHEGARKESNVSLVWKKNREVYPAVEKFIQTAREVCVLKPK